MRKATAYPDWPPCPQCPQCPALPIALFHTHKNTNKNTNKTQTKKLMFILVMENRGRVGRGLSNGREQHA